jgi:hypothetical protein
MAETVERPRPVAVSINTVNCWRKKTAGADYCWADEILTWSKRAGRGAER